MKLTLERFSSGKESTLGLLFIDGKFAAFTCEDEHREEKVAAETRIPAGHYAIKLRKHGGFHSRYSQRFSFHEGMLEICDVPGFTDILIHVGNTEKDTAGCILVGMAAQHYEGGGGQVMYSTTAYSGMYPRLVDEAAAARLSIEIVDRDRSKGNEAG